MGKAILVLAASIVSGMGHHALAQTTTITFDLQEVWLDPDITHTNYPPQPMRGSFEWTFEKGDFENGTGRFTDIYIPWDNPQLHELKFTVDVDVLEFSLIGSYHDRGVDITLHLVKPFSPTRPAVIDLDRSAFEIQRGVTYKGHVINGSVVPRSGGLCDSISRFTAKCKKAKLTARVKSSLLQGTELTVDNEGDIKTMTINDKGKGKVKYKKQTAGAHEVTIVECPQHTRSVNCP